jgi:hypothetical protein
LRPCVRLEIWGDQQNRENKVQVLVRPAGRVYSEKRTEGLSSSRSGHMYRGPCRGRGVECKRSSRARHADRLQNNLKEGNVFMAFRRLEFQLLQEGWLEDCTELVSWQIICPQKNPGENSIRGFILVFILSAFIEQVNK